MLSPRAGRTLTRSQVCDFHPARKGRRRASPNRLFGLIGITFRLDLSVLGEGSCDEFLQCLRC